MNNQTTTYETGATSHAVNDLILFTDNTRLLAELRDSIYTEWLKYGVIDDNFIPLFEAARRHYIHDLKDFGAGHLINMNKGEIKQYCNLYTQDFENWKQEHSLK